MCKLILFPVLLVPLGVDLLTSPASTHGAQRARSGDLLQPPLTAFQGVWSQLHYEASGQVIAERDRHVQLVIRGDRWETRQDGRTTGSGYLHVVGTSAESVLAVDMVYSASGQVVKAIMAVREGRLYVAGPNPGYNRPREFATQAHDETAYTVWRRER